MAELKFSDEQLITLLDQGISIRQAAKQLAVDESSVRTRLKKLKRRGYSPFENHSIIVPEGFRLKGTSTLYDQKGNPVQQWVKSTIDEDQKVSLLDTIKTALLADLPQVIPVPLPSSIDFDNHCLAVYPLGDPHIGLYASAQECKEDWNLHIAKECWSKYYSDIVNTTRPCKEALIVSLGDLFHYDNLKGVTAKSGNVLERDGQYFEMFNYGLLIVRYMIATALLKHQHITVIIETGNHDEIGSICLRAALAHIYENEPRITINSAPGLFHYHHFGNVLIGTHHGHKCKMDQLPTVMACDKPLLWGATQHRYWLTGHIHSSNKWGRKDTDGCIVESFRTLAPASVYDHEGGWRSGRTIQSIVYHENSGEYERHIINI